MRKEEIIQIHTFLIYVRTCIEQLNESNDEHAFTSYESLNVSPHEIYKSKDKQIKAVFELCKGIAKAITVKDLIHIHKITKNHDSFFKK